MGTGQSSHRGESQASDRSTTKKCYYEVLGVERQATDEEVKKAYRRKALELHPDRNFGDVEKATIKFAEVQSAYQVLSDPQERAWYDSHRESILRGNDGPSDEDQFEHNVQLTSAMDIVGLIGKFSPRMPFTDDPNGFYGVLHDTFARLASEEASTCEWEGIEAIEYPEFGCSNDDYEDVVRPFYRIWVNFATRKTFSWRDAYKTADAPDRATRRLIEKENKKLRDEGIREFNDAVRALVAFVRKRDPRFLSNTQSEADRQKGLREAAAAQAARSRAANQAKLDVHIVPDWAKTIPPDDDGEFSDSTESEVECIECVICGKTFKSEKQYETHEKSKKHVKAVREIQREMRKENRQLNLDASSEGESRIPHKEFDGLELTEETDASDTGVGKEILEHGTAPEDNTTIPSSDENTDIQSTPEVLSEVDDEYAPREDVENRLGSTHTLPGVVSDFGAADLASTPTIISPNNDKSGGPPRLGKAKAKRAKKAARQEADAGTNSEFKCVACSHSFSSKTKLFNHIKEEDHAQPTTKVAKSKNKGR